jgi:DNA (cytosine-5)-methyltransferase 1
MKILNLYAGIGGNRKLWGDTHDITAVEIVPEIAKIYQDFFPQDKVIVADAHQYLLEHFKEFDFIWSSPPCPSHSRLRKVVSMSAGSKAIYPDMKLYEEILLLQGYFGGKFVVENVKSWYKPLIEPQELQRHYFWTNFTITPKSFHKDGIETTGRFNPGANTESVVRRLEENHQFNLSECGVSNSKKRTMLRNCVSPEVGLHIFQEAFREYKTLL